MELTGWFDMPRATRCRVDVGSPWLVMVMKASGPRGSRRELSATARASGTC